MKGYDYKFKLIGATKTKEYSYQGLVKLLEIENELLAGRPAKLGGAPQALALKGLLEKQLDDTQVEVHFNGNQIF